MFVDVGPFRYRVRLVHGHVRHEGEDCFGLCDNLQQEILISDVPPERQRLQVFFHELMHAWWYHFGVDPADQEAVVDLVGIAMTDFVMQALRKLDRTELERALAPTTALAADREAASEDRVRSQAKRARSTATPFGTSEEPPRPSETASVEIEQAGWRMRLYEPGSADERAPAARKAI